jgi:hypothetical protein
MVSLLLGSLGVVYLVSAPCFFNNWFSFFKRDAHKLTDEEKQLSMATLVTASVLWPVVVPVAYLNKLSKNNESTSNAQLDFSKSPLWQEEGGI